MSTKPVNPDLKDVEAGSDADATPVPGIGETPSDPNEPETSVPEETGEGDQQDHNIDDMGNKAGGGRLEQPT